MTAGEQRDKMKWDELGPYLDLSQRLLTLEAGDRRGAEDVVEAAELVCGKLRQHLGRRIGPAGFESLLARALHLSKRRFPFLDEVGPGGRDGDCLKGARGSLVGHDSNEVREGLVTVIANLLWLLGRFIGYDMALRQVARLWSQVPIWDIGSGPKETSE